MLYSLGQIDFPKNSGNFFIQVIEWIYKGIGNYGLTIILFTVLVRAAFIPLDFINKYFAKKKAVELQKVKPEHDKLKKLYKDDPLMLQREMRRVNQKYGIKQGGLSSLFSLASMILTFVVFINSFQALGKVSDHNITYQYKQAEVAYTQSIASGDDASTTKAKVNEAYDANQTNFLWVSNIWRPDTWAGKTLSYGDFKKISGNSKQNKQTYNEVMRLITPNQKGWNGLLILVILAGLASWGSAKINAKISSRTKIKFKAQEEEAEPQYSIRATREAIADKAAPMIDLEQVGKIMQLVMPVIMIVFAYISTAAFGIYLISSSVATTLFAFILNFFIELIISKQVKKQQDAKPKEIVINPRTKYFKNMK